MCEVKEKYINIQNGEVLDWDRVEGLKDNAMLKVRPELWCEWDFEKNNELGFDIWKTTKCSRKVVWFICRKCESHYNIKIMYKVKSKDCPYCSSQRVNYTNSLASLNPTLAKEWHPTLNGDLTPHDVTCGIGRKVWWLGKCGHEWEAVIPSRVKGCGCPYCSGMKATSNDNLEVKYPKIAMEWNYRKNKKQPKEYKSKSNQKVWWICEKGHEWEAIIDNRTDKGSGCPCCATYKGNGHTMVVIGFNDMWTTNPDLAKLLHNPEDGYRCSQWSGQKVDWKCPDCEEVIEHRKISDINTQGLPCPKCKDGMSLGERVMYYLLKGLKLKFVFDRKTKWSNNRKYDFNLCDLDIIIEVHGVQHYKKINRKGARTLKEEQANDKLKRELAISNNIKYYIEIDTRKSNFEYIKTSILNSDLLKLFDLKDIDWFEIKCKSSKKLTKDIADLYKNGLKVDDIIEFTGLGKESVRKQLLLSFELGFCERSEDDKNLFITTKKKIIQLTRDLEFIKEWDSVNDATFAILRRRNGKISNACKNKNIVIGGYRWLYKEDYEEFIKGNLHLNKSWSGIKEVVQLSLDRQYIKEWRSSKEAQRVLNLSSSSGILECCKGRSKLANGYKWMYKEDYDQYIEQQNKAV